MGDPSPNPSSWNGLPDVANLPLDISHALMSILCLKHANELLQRKRHVSFSIEMKLGNQEEIVIY